MNDDDLWTIHTDGAARGNPGPSAYSFVITRAGTLVAEEGRCMPDATNNVAEYTALIKALERARELGGRNLLINSDSELMVKQMKGDYKVKHEGLRPLYEEAQKLARGLKVKYQHVRREQNKRADALCNEALDGSGSPKREQPQSDGIQEDPRVAPRTAAKIRALAPAAREEILDCLRSVACAWAAGNPNDPSPEEVWDQLWTILEDAGVLKTVKR